MYVVDEVPHTLKFVQHGTVAAAPLRLRLSGLPHCRNAFAKPIRRMHLAEDAVIHTAATPAGHRPEGEGGLAREQQAGADQVEPGR